VLTACGDTNCDVCATDTCTDCSSGYILNVAGTCVAACPAGQYGVVDALVQCTGGKATANVTTAAPVVVLL
jgi:hypothetical protein